MITIMLRNNAIQHQGHTDTGRNLYFSNSWIKHCEKFGFLNYDHFGKKHKTKQFKRL